MTPNKYAVRLEPPDLHAETPERVVEVVETAREKHVRDWLVEARRRTYDDLVVAEFGRLIDRLDRELRAAGEEGLWTNGAFRVETTASEPARPQIVHRTTTDPLTAERFRAIADRLPPKLRGVLDEDVRTSVDGSLEVYNAVTAARATEQLRDYVATATELSPRGGDRRDAPTAPTATAFDPTDHLVPSRLPNEAEYSR